MFLSMIQGTCDALISTRPNTRAQPDLPVELFTLNQPDLSPYAWQLKKLKSG